jgi:ParB/RepB/Spo0J family partition protein
MAKKRTISVPFESIECDHSFNARSGYRKIDELAESIKQNGLLQNIGVSEKKGEPGQYLVVYGFRRYLALEKIRAELGPEAFATVDVMLNEGTREELRDRMVKENIDRDQLEPHEIASIIKTMVNSGLEQRDIGTRLGRPQSWVSYHYKVATKLGTAAWTAFKNNSLTLEQALHISDVPEEEQAEVVDTINGAETRTEARQIAKKASEIAGGRRTYTNKGRPTAKNIAQYVSDASFDGSSNIVTPEEKQFYNGVAAGLRVAIGDAQFGNLQATEEYFDTDFHAKGKDAGAKGKAKNAKASAAETPEDGVAAAPKKRGRQAKLPAAAAAAAATGATAPKRRGRPPKKPVAVTAEEAAE